MNTRRWATLMLALFTLSAILTSTLLRSCAEAETFTPEPAANNEGSIDHE